MIGDGNGWAAAPEGGKAWGRFGAAGLFLFAPTTGQFLLQHRALWTAHGGTWALPGGARDSHETAAETALREATEETQVDCSLIEILDEFVTAGPFEADKTRPELAGQWTYTTVLAQTTSGQPIPTTPNEESLDLRWVTVEEARSVELLPAFAESLSPIMSRMTTVLE